MNTHLKEITENKTIQALIAADVSGVAWTVADIADTVAGELGIELDTDDVDVFGLLLNHFNGKL